MGISSSRSTTKETVNRNTSEQTSGTRTPMVPANLQSGFDDLIGRVGQFAGQDPATLVAGTSPLQQRAFSAAGKLGGWQGYYDDAADMARGVGGANLAGSPALASYGGYQAPTIASPQGYGAASAGATPQVGAQGYSPTMFGGVTLAPTERAQATDATAQSLLTNLPAYMNPYTNDVVDTTLAGVDENAGRVRAAQAANAARNRALGGSRYALREAQTEGELDRSRAATEAGLRDRAFTVGAGLSADDANRRQQVSIGNADRTTGVSTFNAGQGNARNLAQAGFDQQTGLFNTDATSRAAEFLAGSRERSGLANADLASRHALDFAGRSDTARQFGLGQQQQTALAQAELLADASRYAADAGNQQSTINSAALNRQGEFNAGQRDQAQARELQAAQLLGGLGSDLAGNQRADVQTQGALGGQQQAIDQAQRLSQLAQLQAVAQLYGIPAEALIGQAISGNTTGTMTGSGTSVTTQSPSLFSQLLGGLSLLPMPGGK